MNEHLLFFLFWVLNSLVFRLADLLFSGSIVLGTWRLTPVEASIYAAFWLTFFVWTMWDYMLLRKVVLEPLFLRIFFFFVINSLGIWLVSRYANYTGLGIGSFWWAFALGAVTVIVQTIAWKLGGKKFKG